MYIRFSCNVKNGSLSIAVSSPIRTRMHTVQCPYTYEQRQHVNKKYNGIASISNSLIAAVVKRLRSVSDNEV